MSNGIPFIRIENIKGGFDIDDAELIYISEFDHMRLSNSALKVDDLILSKVGNSIGYFARVDELINECNISENNIGIKLHSLPYERKHYILTYLNTHYANKLVLRRRSGNAQPKLNVGDLTYIPIPLFSTDLELKISELVIRSKYTIELSKSAYRDAENILLNKLELIEWRIPSKTQSVKKVSESFIESGRLDAEYYQPKYDELIRLVKSHQSGYGKLGTLFLIKDRNYIPENDCLYKYIELSNIGFDGSITGYTEALGEDLPSRARRIVRSGDLIVSSLEGSLNSCAIIPEKYDGAICSTGFYVLTPKDINVETALVLFKSQLMQALMTRVCSGSIMAGMNTDEFANLIVPKIDQHTQHVIAEIIQDCAQKREESIRLLELAKTAVEVAIEQGEDKAMELLTQDM